MSLNRRRHRLFVTRNTEYHLRADECVGVRDRETGQWLRDHAALRLRALKLPPAGHDHVWLGQRIQFWGSNTDVVTSPVVAVGRPPRESIDHYVSLMRAGAIAC
ncbi:MAG: hypothetical protein U0168_31745 [Nannocystaceae bacterium]|jgi:hypothetical protein